MKAKREYLDYFQDILDALEKIDNFTAGLDLESFVKDDKTTYAVIRALEIIGEPPGRFPNPSARVIPTYPGRTWRG